MKTEYGPIKTITSQGVLETWTARIIFSPNEANDTSIMTAIGKTSVTLRNHLKQPVCNTDDSSLIPEETVAEKEQTMGQLNFKEKYEKNELSIYFMKDTDLKLFIQIYGKILHTTSPPPAPSHSVATHLEASIRSPSKAKRSNSMCDMSPSSNKLIAQPRPVRAARSNSVVVQPLFQYNFFLETVDHDTPRTHLTRQNSFSELTSLKPAITNLPAESINLNDYGIALPEKLLSTEELQQFRHPSLLLAINQLQNIINALNAMISAVNHENITEFKNKIQNLIKDTKNLLTALNNIPHIKKEWIQSLNAQLDAHKTWFESPLITALNYHLAIQLVMKNAKNNPDVTIRSSEKIRAANLLASLRTGLQLYPTAIHNISGEKAWPTPNSVSTQNTRPYFKFSNETTFCDINELLKKSEALCLDTTEQRFSDPKAALEEKASIPSVGKLCSFKRSPVKPIDLSHYAILQAEPGEPHVSSDLMPFVVVLQNINVRVNSLMLEIAAASTNNVADQKYSHLDKFSRKFISQENREKILPRWAAILNDIKIKISELEEKLETETRDIIKALLTQLLYQFKTHAAWLETPFKAANIFYEAILLLAVNGQQLPSDRQRAEKMFYFFHEWKMLYSHIALLMEDAKTMTVVRDASLNMNWEPTLSDQKIERNIDDMYDKARRKYLECSININETGITVIPTENKRTSTHQKTRTATMSLTSAPFVFPKPVIPTAIPLLPTAVSPDLPAYRSAKNHYPASPEPGSPEINSPPPFVVRIDRM